MIRRSGFVTMVGGALIVSACGRQVTPSAAGTSPASGVPAGFMQVKFRTVAPFDFSTYSYVVVFNTSGDGSTPIATPSQNAFAGYSFAIAVTGAGGSASAAPYTYSRLNGPGTQPLPIAFQPAPQLFRFTLNTNGQGNEFTIIFNRQAIAGFNPSTSPTPSPSPTPTATATPTPSPSPTASGSASPSPSPSPTATPNFATTWEYNFFVVQGQFSSQQSTVVDSLGQGGATDATYASTPIDTTTAYESGPIYPKPGTHPTTGAAAILSGDIANAP